MKERSIFSQLVKRMLEPRKFIQVLLGPRQVGKTTLAQQVAAAVKKPSHYITADLAHLQNTAWISQQWEVARNLVKPGQGALLIIDEVQKIPHWSDIIKTLWDQDTRNQLDLSVIILGSSPWLMQKGLSESLAGRFENIPITHWSFKEMQEHFGWGLDQYIYFGGYPGAASLADPNDPSRWVQYINDALIKATLSRDILLMTQVNKPALLRRLFQLHCNYSCQISSYSKKLGELQDAGNTTTLAHYLELLAGAGLLDGIQKFAIQRIRQKASSPKFAVFNTALMSAQSGKTFKQARKDGVFWGRLVESSVAAYLLNAIRGTQVELFYWREGDDEVDFVLRSGDSITAIEVKTGTLSNRTGIDHFVNKFKPDRVLLIGDEGISIEKFFLTPLSHFI